MFGANRRLPILPVCAGLVFGLGALACSDRRDDTARTSSEYGTAATPDGTVDTAVSASTGVEDANVKAEAKAEVATSEPIAPARRPTARRSTPATTSDDPYAADREAAARRDRANVGVTAEVSAADPAAKPAEQPADDRADANRSAEQNRAGDVAVTAPTAEERTQLENAGVLPKGPTLNDHQVMNIVLLSNAGDSARAAEILADAPATTTVAAGEVAVAAPAPPPPAEAAAPSAAVRTEVSAPVCIEGPEKSKECPTLPETQANVTIESDQSKAPVTSYDAGRSVAPPAPSADAEISMDAVRSLAQTMLRDHTALNARAASVASSDNLVPTESAVSVDVFNTNREVKAEDVEELSPAAREWLNREVRLHEEALAMIESQLLPAASDDELKALLEEERQKTQSHLTMARQLLGTPSTTTPVPMQPSDLNHQQNNMSPAVAPATTPAAPVPSDTIRPKTEPVRP